jgi:hypothetical protein
MDRKTLKDSPVFAYFIVALLSFFIRWLLDLDSSTDIMTILFASWIWDGYVRIIAAKSAGTITTYPWNLYLKYILSILAINSLFSFVELWLTESYNINNLFISSLISVILLFGFGYWESRKFKVPTSQT